MKKLFLIPALLGAFAAFAQTESFDLATYSPVKGWQKQVSANYMQLYKEDKQKGSYCIITLFKSIDAGPDPKKNFDNTWEAIVKGMVTANEAPSMLETANKDEWQLQSGYAPCEVDGNKALAMLVTATGYGKMVNLVTITNTDAFQSDMEKILASVDLKKPAAVQQNNKGITTTVKNSTPAVTNTAYKFTTTNFDDGWTSNVKEDWVEVTKADITVLLHYPREGTIFPADPDVLTNAAWNILVAPRYSNLKNYRTAYITDYNRPYIATGYATDKVTGNEVFIVFFRQGDTGWMEIIAPDKNSFIRQYRFDPETIRYDSNTDLITPLVQMVNYNKFAIAASDFSGTWSSDFTGTQHYYNAYTGAYAGMNLHQSNITFKFTGNSYNWSLVAVNGMVGNMKFAQVKSAGKFSVLNNWQMRFSDIEGKPKTYNVFFSCIKGARVLKMLDADTPGSGIYTAFGKK